MNKKCLVKDCPNTSNLGVFIGDLCAPCHDALSTGRAVHSFMVRRLYLPSKEIIKELPCYENSATQEEKNETLEWMSRQYNLVREQEKIGTPIRNVKIRCGCNKLVGWMYMYRCLYCGIWFCRDCAQLHFGKRLPEPFADVVR